MIPYGRQTISEKDVEAVAKVLRSDWLTQGPWVKRFEERLAECCGARFAVAVSSGTAALHLACLAAGIGPGDCVAVPTLTFVASANCALYCGGQPVLADVDSKTLILNSQSLAAIRPRQKKWKAVIPVHFAGLPCDMEEIQRWARQEGALVIEDACHALGARWKDSRGVWHRVGDCSCSDLTCFSFHPVKHITTGEGGAILTNNPELYAKLEVLRTHGITKDPGRLIRCDGGWYYEMQALGFNYRITDFQCALGFSQLDELPAWVARRRAIADRYREAFCSLCYMAFQDEPPGFESSYHLFVVRVPRRREVFQRLREKGLGVQVHYIPMHLQPYYQERLGYRAGDFPSAESYYEAAISLPVFPAMTDEEVKTVITLVQETAQELGIETARPSIAE